MTSNTYGGGGIKLTLLFTLIAHNPFRVCDYMGNMITDVKKYDINRRVYLPKWVEEDLGLVPGESYVTFDKEGTEVVRLRKVKIVYD